MSPSGHELAALKPRLLKELGRDREALEVVWARYRQQPSKYSYDDLMQLVPSPERARWHERAIRAAMAVDLSSLIGLLCETGEIERLAEVVRGSSDDALEAVSHSVLEPAATRLEQTQPGVAARLWRAVGMRVVNAGKSRYYDAAIGSLARARRCYEQAGLTADWQQVVSLVRGRHHRKTGFMPGFEAMVEGSGTVSSRRFWSGRRRAGVGRLGRSPEHAGCSALEHGVVGGFGSSKPGCPDQRPIARCGAGGAARRERIPSARSLPFPSPFPPPDAKPRGTERNRWDAG